MTEKRYHANVRNYLKEFVIGSDFDSDDALKPMRTDDGGIWEIKIMFEPQERIFGAFLRKGEFIATNNHGRTALAHPRKGFAPHHARCRSIWASLFPDHRRQVGLERATLLEGFRP